MPSGPVADIEQLRNILTDPRVWIQLGEITQLEPSPDFSVLRVMVKTYPEEDEIVCRMAWSMCGARFPLVSELVLVCFVDGEEDEAYVFARLSSSSETIPLRALTGALCLYHPDGGKAHLWSDDKVTLGRGIPLFEEDEPLVLGNVMKSALDAFMGTLDGHFDDIKTALGDIRTGPVGLGNLGYPVATHPTLIAKLAVVEAAITAAKAQLALDIAEYLTFIATNIISQIAFTER